MLHSQPTACVVTSCRAATLPNGKLL